MLTTIRRNLAGEKTLFLDRQKARRQRHVPQKQLGETQDFSS